MKTDEAYQELLQAKEEFDRVYERVAPVTQKEEVEFSDTLEGRIHEHDNEEWRIATSEGWNDTLGER